MPKTGLPAGNDELGHQCSTTQRLPTLVHRSVRSSSNAITTEPSLTVAFPFDDRSGSTSVAESLSNAQVSTTPLANSICHLPVGKPSVAGGLGGSPAAKKGITSVTARMATI